MNPALRPFVLLAACVLLPVAAALWLLPDGDVIVTTANESFDAPPPPSGEKALPDAGPSPADRSVERFFIGQGGTLAQACDRAGLAPETREAVMEVAARHLDLRRLSPRTGVSVTRDGDDEPVSLAIRSEPNRFLRITLPQDGTALRAELLPLPTEVETKTAGGVVSKSVGQALGHTANSRMLTQAYSDIFQWDVDLLVDPRPGDKVRVIYEVESLGEVPSDLPRFGNAAMDRGDFVGLGRILAASYDGAIAEATAFWVEGGSQWGNYYDASGRPLRKSFLKSPLNYRRISSGFSRARRHPVTRRVVPHHGVDFAAAPGTPVTATADGRVVSAGWDGPLGIAVRLRHGGGYVTVYGHLKSFARGIKSGVEVTQGQVIGYVGSTGRATGPHLHYTVLKGGRPIDPMKMKNPSVEPLDEGMLPWLAASRRRFEPLLATIHTEPRLEFASDEAESAGDTTLLGGG